MSNIILASASPRRRELMQRMGFDFEVITSGIDEQIDACLSPELLVCELALLKACDVAKKIHGDYLIIGADTLVFLNGKSLGKPESQACAKEMLRALSGKTHQVCTGVCTIRTSDAKTVCRAEVTNVKFKDLTDDLIEWYVSTGEPMDKAGAYGIQEKGNVLVDNFDGDFNNVVGLPTDMLGKLLINEFDLDLTNKTKR